MAGFANRDRITGPPRAWDRFDATDEQAGFFYS